MPPKKKAASGYTAVPGAVDVRSVLRKSTTVVAVLSDNTGARWIDHAQECRELPQRFY
eukprot:gene6565-32190_t